MLALGFSEGEDVMIGKDRLIVERIRGSKAASLTFETEYMVQKHELIERRDVQLKPYVVVTVGLPKTGSGHQITLCFDAPRSIEITRGDLYRKWGGSHMRPAS